MERGMVGMLRRGDTRQSGELQRSLAEIQALRQRHPFVDAAAGLIPGVGMAQGAMDVTDGSQSGMERTLAVLGMVPGGRMLKMAKDEGGDLLKWLLRPALDETQDIPRVPMKPNLEATQDIVLGEGKTLEQTLADRAVRDLPVSEMDELENKILQRVLRETPESGKMGAGKQSAVVTQLRKKDPPERRPLSKEEAKEFFKEHFGYEVPTPVPYTNKHIRDLFADEYGRKLDMAEVSSLSRVLSRFGGITDQDVYNLLTVRPEHLPDAFKKHPLLGEWDAALEALVRK